MMSHLKSYKQRKFETEKGKEGSVCVYLKNGTVIVFTIKWEWILSNMGKVCKKIANEEQK